MMTRDAVCLQAAKHEERLAHLSRMYAAVAELNLAIAAFDLHDLQAKLQIARVLGAYPADLAQGDARVVQLIQRNLDADAFLIGLRN